MERIPGDSWFCYPDHVRRYEYARLRVLAGEEVNDIACGAGYGAVFLAHAIYRGYDKPGIPEIGLFPGMFYASDLNDPAWEPRQHSDVTTCFETIEHVRNPWMLAGVISRTTRRAIILSVPLYPKTENEYHLTDFTAEEVPLMFPGFTTAEDWPQPEARGHVWLLTRESADA